MFYGGGKIINETMNLLDLDMEQIELRSDQAAVKAGVTASGCCSNPVEPRFNKVLIFN